MLNELELKQVPCKAAQKPVTALVLALPSSGKQISWIITKQLPLLHISFLRTKSSSKPKPSTTTRITETRAPFPAKGEKKTKSVLKQSPKKIFLAVLEKNLSPELIQ